MISKLADESKRQMNRERREVRKEVTILKIDVWRLEGCGGCSETGGGYSEGSGGCSEMSGGCLEGKVGSSEMNGGSSEGKNGR